MRYLAAFASLAIASSALAQAPTQQSSPGLIHSVVTSSVAHGKQSDKLRVQPLNASLVLTVDVPFAVQVFPSDYQDHSMSVNVTNTSKDTITVQFHRHQLFLGNWTTSVCFGSSCYSSAADSGSSLYAMAPDSSAALLIHFDNSSSIQVPIADTVRTMIVVQQEPGTSTDTIQVRFMQITDPALAVAANPMQVTETSASILSLYPNPSSQNGHLITAQIYSPSRGVSTISVYDISGQKLREVTLAQEFQRGVNVLRFDPSGLSSGTYMLGVSIGGAPQISKRFEVTK
jgi:hypothetical protein